MPKQDNDRFICIHKEDDNRVISTKILVDKVTGIQYIFHVSGYAGGMTVLLDQNGKPLLYQPIQ